MKKRIGNVVLILAVLTSAWSPGLKVSAAEPNIAATTLIHPDPDSLIGKITQLLTHVSLHAIMVLPQIP